MSSIDIEPAAMDRLRRRGCTCEPEISVRWLSPTATETTVHHDAWCALMIYITATWN